MTNPKHTDTSRSGDLVERLRGGWNGWTTLTESEAADLIETQAREIERLRGALEQIEAGTYPRPLGKPWRMDASSSKHDRCIHDEWMYETCEACLDTFVRAALGEQP